MTHDVEETDDSHLARVMQDPHAFAREKIAADAKRLQRRIEFLELANDFRCVQIAGRLAGDDGSFI